MFDGAKVFTKIALVLFGAAFLAIPYVGFWLFIPAFVASYYLLHYCNTLERHDRRDRRRGR
jgi:hypothetical protein